MLTAAPGRVRIRIDQPALFWKILRPGRAAPLVHVHSALKATIPVPACRFCDDDLGLVVLEGLRGDTLRSRLRRGSSPLPEPAAVVDLLDRLAAVALGGAPAPTTAIKVRRPARMLRAILP